MLLSFATQECTDCCPGTGQCQVRQTVTDVLLIESWLNRWPGADTLGHLSVGITPFPSRRGSAARSRCLIGEERTGEEAAASAPQIKVARSKPPTHTGAGNAGVLRRTPAFCVATLGELAVDLPGLGPAAGVPGTFTPPPALVAVPPVSAGALEPSAGPGVPPAMTPELSGLVGSVSDGPPGFLLVSASMAAAAAAV
jgi:hypothetical protein